MLLPKTISLDGSWDFFYTPQKFIPGRSALPAAELFTGKIVTPGYWDDHYELFSEEDFFGLNARFNPDYRKPYFPMARSLSPHASSSFLIGSGYYRKILNVDFSPDDRVALTVGPAMWGCSVYCGGTLAGSVTGYSTASTFDLTELLEPGKDYELILVVCNVHDDGGAYCRLDGSHDGEDYGTRPGQHRGLAAQGYQSERAGIGGGVSLRITGHVAFKDYFVSFENGKLHWHVESLNAVGKNLIWQVFDQENLLDSGSLVCESNEFEFFSETLLDRWSDRAPKLYRFSLELRDGNSISDIVTWKYGPRSVFCRETRILVNGLPTYFRGATEHCYFAATCNPHFDKQQYLHDLGILRSAGFNFIRCHTWCPPEPFYEACDELGIFVQTELPSVYSFEEAEMIIRMIRHHSCAVIFCEGNEKKMTDAVLERMRRLVNMLHELAPGMLFNPQEAMRGVEYEFIPGRTITQEPFPHDAMRLAEVSEFSDLYGSLGGGYFSYINDEFPGTAEVERQHTIYKKPCLSHEIGILGGYLDFSLEPRYEGTFIGQDLFCAARDNMQRHGVYQYAEIYYKYNCRFIAALRKQLIENLRSCSNITGYDYLGGIDTHWHLTGYPCGIFNEFYEEKYGETIADIRCYNNESVLLCSAANDRNRFCGRSFKEKLLLSYFGEQPEAVGELHWWFELPGGSVIVQGTQSFDHVPSGEVTPIALIEFVIPEAVKPYCGLLKATAFFNGKVIENSWKIWIFPQVKTITGSGVCCSNVLTDKLISFAENGGAVLLTGDFPTQTWQENFRTHTSGRSLGHSGMLLHNHPVWRHFPNEGFGDWQFFPIMTGSTSIIYDENMPHYQPLFELIPSFKLIQRKSMLSEFRTGRGRIIMCGFNLENKDPAAQYLKYELLVYLDSHNYVSAPEWNPNDLRIRQKKNHDFNFKIVKTDEGGRPVYN